MVRPRQKNVKTRAGEPRNNVPAVWVEERQGFDLRQNSLLVARRPTDYAGNEQPLMGKGAGGGVLPGGEIDRYWRLIEQKLS